MTSIPGHGEDTDPPEGRGGSGTHACWSGNRRPTRRDSRRAIPGPEEAGPLAQAQDGGDTLPGAVAFTFKTTQVCRGDS